MHRLVSSCGERSARAPPGSSPRPLRHGPSSSHRSPSKSHKRCPLPWGRASRSSRRRLPTVSVARVRYGIAPRSRPRKGSRSRRRTADAAVGNICVNPAAPAGGTAPLDPYLPSLALRFLGGHHRLKIKTPWVSFPGEYSARCESSGNATWLQVTHVGSHDRRPQLTKAGRRGTRPPRSRCECRTGQSGQARPRSGCGVHSTMTFR